MRQPVPLTAGAYQARSLIAAAQRCVNLYPEKNPEGSPFPFTLYPTPGLTLRNTAPVALAGRCLYRASNGQLFGVVGTRVYFIDTDWSFTDLGAVTVGRSNICYMADNGTTIILVDGSTSGWSINLSTHAYAVIPDVDFLGGDRVDYLDTFFLLNQPNTRNWYVSEGNAITFDPLDIVAKSGNADNIQTIIANSRVVWLLGTLTSELWFNEGGAGFPYVEFPGTFIEHGTVARYSLASSDVAIYWLSQDKQGHAIVLKGLANQAKRISTHAIETAISGYSTISDAIGFTYQQEGHVFYVLTFPTADRTWAYDEASELWHERVWLDTDGDYHRIRPNCCAFAYGENLCLDHTNGRLLSLDLDTYRDVTDPILRIASFPHILNGRDRIIFHEFVADMEPGQDDGVIDGSSSASPPVITLRWSDTNGISYNSGITQSLGAAGQYLTSIKWPRLGMARGRVFELSWSVPAKTALNGGWVRATKAGT